MSVFIPEVFRGPPRSGNGGYVSGVFAAQLSAGAPEGVEVTLRSPVPLDKTLETREEDGVLSVFDGETLVAEARARAFEVHIPTPPSFEDALAKQETALSLQQREGASGDTFRGMHPWCYCCGAGHEDGLYVYAARMDDTQVAAAWKTKAEWGDGQGLLTAPVLWTALDCPGQVAYAVEGIRTGLLGRITAKIHAPAPAGDDYVVTAWREEVDGKKHFAGSAVFSSEGNLIASARSVWIGRRD